MTEGAANVSEMAVRPSYEEIVGSIRHSGVQEILRHIEVEKERMSRQLERLEQDEDLNGEAKERRAQEILDRYNPKISEAYKSAKEKIAVSAESSYKFSIPMPGEGKTLASARVSDPTEMVAVQNETSALLTRAERLKAKASMADRAHAGGNDGMRLSYDPAQRVLKEAYDRAMSAGGVEDKITGLAVVKAAEALGVDLEAIVGDHRREVHYRALEDQRHFERAWQVMPSGKKAVPNPFSSRRLSARRVGTYSSGNKAAVHSTDGHKVFQKRNRKRAWK